MKAITLKNRLTKRFVGSKNSKAYSAILDLINQTNKSYMVNGSRIRPVYTLGSGRFITKQDHTFAIEQLLELLGIRYEKGNDAPRGGQVGNYIDIKTKIEC